MNAVTNCLFEEPWWLDAVAPGQWSAASIERGGRLVARLPFVMQQRYGLKLAVHPPLTQTLGPWIEPGEGKYASTLSDQHALISELIARLPKVDLFVQTFPPGLTNCLPFHWKGFATSVRYTYRLEQIGDTERVWTDFTEKTRNVIRKATKTLSVRDDLDPMRFCDIAAKSWSRQGLRPSFSRELFARLHAECVKRKAGRIFHAVDAQSRVHAAIFLVWDSRSAYYLAGGGDPELRNSGAHSLLIWAAIRFASGISQVFDFEGSMNQSIEHFCRSFGSRQTPLLQVRRLSRLMAVISAVKDLSAAVSGNHIKWFY